MVKNIKLSSVNVRWHLRTLSVAKAQNINSAPCICVEYCLRDSKWNSKNLKSYGRKSKARVLSTWNKQLVWMQKSRNYRSQSRAIRATCTTASRRKKPHSADLFKEDLLERYFGDHTQNANENFNLTVWRLTPKRLRPGREIIEIAAYLTASIFNEGMQLFSKLCIRPNWK